MRIRIPTIEKCIVNNKSHSKPLTPHRIILSYQKSMGDIVLFCLRYEYIGLAIARWKKINSRNSTIWCDVRLYYLLSDLLFLIYGEVHFWIISVTFSIYKPISNQLSRCIHGNQLNWNTIGFHFQCIFFNNSHIYNAIDYYYTQFCIWKSFIECSKYNFSFFLIFLLT